MAIAGTIDEVLQELAAVTAKARQERSRLGYFACLYRRVTSEVKRGIETGRFEDGPRMERLDVVFANHYLEALGAWRAGRPVSGCWRLAFEAAAQDGHVILQDLLAGMNAHINLDLAVAAAEVAPGASIHALRNDFMEINRVLAEQIDGVQDALGPVSPWLWILDVAGGRREEWLVEFSLEKARNVAWRNALELAQRQREAWTSPIASMDTLVEGVGRAVLNPPGRVLRTALWIIRKREEKDPLAVMQSLES